MPANAFTASLDQFFDPTVKPPTNAFQTWFGDVQTAAKLSACSVVDILAAPPGTPTLGAFYLVASSGASGAFSSQENKIAHRTKDTYGSATEEWVFIAPFTGMQVFVQDEACFYRYSGSSWLRIYDSYPVRASKFGVDPTGVAECSAEMQAFIDEVISSGRPGIIEAGTYLVDEDVLNITCTDDAQGPIIHTAGHWATIFKANDAADGPILKITNPTSGDGSGKYWRGGHLGGIRFVDESGATATSRHAMTIHGIQYWTFEPMRFTGIRADAINIPNRMYGGSNPDPYHVVFNIFRGLEAASCVGYVIKNANGVGFGGNIVVGARGIQCGGGIYDGGAGNVYLGGSFGACSGGWVIDIAPSMGASRILFDGFEMDDCEYGIRNQDGTDIHVRSSRFVHRCAGHTEYWPKVAIQLSNGGGSAVRRNSYDVIHRVESGTKSGGGGPGVLGDLGDLLKVDYSGSCLLEVKVSHIVFDNASLGVTYEHGRPTQSHDQNSLTVLFNGQEIVRQFQTRGVLVRDSGALVVKNGGFTGGSNYLIFNTSSYDPQGLYNVSTGEVETPQRGWFRVFGRITLSLTAGDVVRIGVAGDTSFYGAMRWVAPDTGVHAIPFDFVIFVAAAGVQLQLNADNDSGGDKTATAVVSAGGENYMFVEPI